MPDEPELPPLEHLREVAHMMFLVRSHLEHADIPGARNAARSLVRHLERVPDDPGEYERLCERLDAEIASEKRAGGSKRAGF